MMMMMMMMKYIIIIIIIIIIIAMGSLPVRLCVYSVVNIVHRVTQCRSKHDLTLETDIHHDKQKTETTARRTTSELK